MKTKADIIRRLQEPGVLVQTTYHGGGWTKGDPPARRVLSCTTHQVVFEGTAWSRGEPSYLYWPSVSEITFVDENTFELPGLALGGATIRYQITGGSNGHQRAAA